MEFYQKIIKVKESGKPIVLATVVQSLGSAPRSEGAKMLVYQDGSIDGTIGGGAVEKAVLDEALTLMGKNETKLLSYDLGNDLAMQCGGKMTIFLESLTPQPQLFIFGAGHIGAVLVDLGNMLGFVTTVIDNRPEFAKKERLPKADVVISEEYSKALKKITITSNAFIVLVTHKHTHDQEILEYCINQPFKYLGMIASKTKVKKVFDLLRNKGVAEKSIKKVHSPIGLDIGADTPEELAVAIAGEMIAVRSNKLVRGDIQGMSF